MVRAWLWGLFVVAALCGFLVCPRGWAGGEKPLVRWDVYRDSSSRDNHGHWTNWMPAESGKMMKLNLADKTDPQAGETCIRVAIRWREPYWCGLAVSCAPDYWGEKAMPAYDLRRARKLRFQARGEKGDESIMVKVAITGGGDKPFGDSATSPAATEWLSLTRSWKLYELDLTDVDLRRTVVPFAFVSSKDRNGRDITFFLDEIHILLEDER